ncbi:methyltransferase domain-containing protein [Sedimenticola hydrogenitrophicus]|uniref:methyltransferase domain-containing protein n=1 Tax=Sedimenticola hydrogenitrophicus TaxID=2967975 RepID=UPI0021A84149|nr:methyltransferase domain-containing protein [Sedimenticola hydrogenitrophicus]
MNSQYSGSPAEVYERHFVPALFRQWGDVLADTAKVGPGDRVLDVACGTGVLACAAAARAGADGEVSGLDINPEMLDVARQKGVPIDWRQGRAEAIPYQNDSFDRVVSQFGFMFFEDQAAALREMLRVLRPGGHLAVAVCDALDHSPGYAVLAELLHRLFGDGVAEAFRAPFSCGHRELLVARAETAGITDSGRRAVTVDRHDGQVVFPSVEALVSTERACAWTLGGLLDAYQFGRLAAEAEESFRPFLTAEGAVAFDMPVLILSAIK